MINVICYNDYLSENCRLLRESNDMKKLVQVGYFTIAIAGKLVALGALKAINKILTFILF